MEDLFPIPPSPIPNNQTTIKNFCADDVIDSMPLFRSGGGGAIPTSALQLQISRCNVHRACALNELWHSRFPKIDWSNVVRNKDYACYVAEYDDIAYAVAILSSPIAANRLTEGKTALELRRMAICNNAPTNTASRMIGIMRRIIAKEMPHLTLLVSYQDADVHAGTIYKASGWKAVAQNKGTSWTNETRQRNEEQSLADKVRWEYRLKPMNDYWNDPPEYEELPECCDEEMQFDEATRVCSCAICGKTIQPPPEYDEPPEREPRLEPFELWPDPPENCPHGNKPEDCDHCDYLSDIAYDAAREARFFGR